MKVKDLQELMQQHYGCCDECEANADRVDCAPFCDIAKAFAALQAKNDELKAENRKQQIEIAKCYRIRERLIEQRETICTRDHAISCYIDDKLVLTAKNDELAKQLAVTEKALEWAHDHTTVCPKDGDHRLTNEGYSCCDRLNTHSISCHKCYVAYALEQAGKE